MRSHPPALWREFPAALAALDRALSRVKAPSAIIDGVGGVGGVAVIARGVPRFTEDIDATVAGVARVRRMLAPLGQHLDGPDRIGTLDCLLAALPPATKAPRVRRTGKKRGAAGRRK